MARQEKTIELSLEGLESGKDPLLPPLMNPTMLEASDDLTNLSHLNEPAGMLPLQDPVFSSGQSASWETLTW